MKELLREFLNLIQQYNHMRKISRESKKLYKDLQRYSNLLDDIRARTAYANALINEYNHIYGADLENIKEI